VSAPREDKNEERRQALLVALADAQPATAAMLAELVGQLDSTVRRDLDVLHNRGRVATIKKDGRGWWWRVA
jgi:predicted ArsR family transcriptional regulator